MAVTENVFLPIGDPGGPASGQTQFSFNFPYLENTDVKVSLDGVDTIEYTFANATTIQFNTAPADGVVVRIYRDTNNDNPRAVFYPGSVIRAQDLNDNFDQILYVTQEVDNNAWDNETDTVKSTNPWVSSDEKVATTAAIDARFQDELNDTLDSNEAWVSSDNYIATTASIDQRIDTAITSDIAGSDGISITDDGDGTITVGISANSVDLDRIKDEDIITYAEQEAGNSWLSDTRIPTTFAAARRFDTLVQPTTPTGSTWAVGKTWLQNDQDLTVSVWNGSAWLAVASGGAFTNQPKVVYVDATAGDDGNDGHRISRPKQTIKAAIAQINADATYGDGSVVVVAPGVYQEVAPIDITKKDVSIIGTALRSCIVHPTPATETNSLFRVNSGTFLQNLTFTGVKASGVRGGVGSVDPDATYGLPVTQGWNVSFYPGAMIYKSPYIQNCTNFSDSEINNANLNAHTPAGGSAGDTDSAVTGGGLLVDGAVVDSSSPLRSMVCDSYTHVGLDGPGILVTNNGYAQCTSSYAFFNHYHIKCLNGGQANLAASTTDFGRFGLIADGRSPNAIFTAVTTADAADGDITFTIDEPVVGINWHGTATRPQSNMLVDIGGNTYPVLSAVANGTGWDVTISRPDPTNTADNLGLNGAVLTGATASFFLRSMVASSGHTMEYAGSGTNYSALPENGGVPIEANQVLELNNGKVWTAITDHNGKFKLGNFFTVDQQTSTVSVQTGSFAVSLENLQVNPGGNAVIGANLDLNGSAILDSLGNVTIADVLYMSNNKITGLGAPTDATDATTKSYVDGYAVAKAGDTMTGQLKLVGDPVADEDAARKKYVDDTVSASVAAADEWVRAGTTISPKTAGDVVEFSAGTAALPGLTPVGDPNTGIYSPGADQLALSVSGSEKVRLTTTGLGIGTSNPSRKLDVQDESTTDEVARFYSNASKTVSVCSIWQDGAGASGAALKIRNDGSGNALEVHDGSDGNRTFVIDSSSRVGIGTTPDAALHVRPGTGNAYALHLAAASDLGDYVRMRFLRSDNSTENAWIFSDGANGLRIGAASSRTIAFEPNNAEAARFDTSGRLLVGTSSAPSAGDGQYSRIVAQGYTGLATGHGYMSLARGQAAASISSGDEIGTLAFTDSAGYSFARISCTADAPAGSNDYPGRLVFSTTADGASSPTERMRITADGTVLINTTSTNPADDAGWQFGSNSTTFNSVAASTSGTNTLHVYSTTASAYRFYVGMDGTVNATNTTISAISDQRLKENIRDLDTGLAEILSLQPRRFDWKAGKGKNIQNDQGFIAQEFEQVFPEMIGEWIDPAPEGEEPYKSVRADLVPVLVKAIQEQQAIINGLEARLAALEAN